METDGVQADIELMQWASHTLRDAIGVTGDSFAVHHADLDAAMSGWAGSSKGALESLLGRWRSAANTLVTTGDGHADGIRTAAMNFAAEQAEHAAAFVELAIGSNSAAAAPALNL